MADHYPYQQPFENFLIQQGLAPLTVATYATSLTSFFDFLRANRPAFAHDPQVDAVTETDVRTFFNYLKDDRAATLATTNKVLSHLNRYFRYLFTHQLIHGYPTLTLHGALPRPAVKVSPKWVNQLDQLLESDQLHFYTRLTLFLSAKGYTVGEFLAPDFGQQLQRLTPQTKAEADFLAAFATFHQPLEELQGCADPFLKTRLNHDQPRLTNAGLHKYLKADESLTNFSLAPRNLHQGYVLNQLRLHRDWSDQQLMEVLRIDPASLLYYRRLLFNQDRAEQSAEKE